jgi:hypothetical protein
MKSGTEKSTEKIKELQVSIYNLNKESKDLTSLVDKFDELNEKVFKTAEDLREIESILAKIDEYGGNKYDFVLAGKLDREAIELYLKATEEEKKEKLQEIRVEGKSNLRAMLRGVEQTAETRASIMEYLASTIDGFDEMDKDLQNAIRFGISRDLEGTAKTMGFSLYKDPGTGARSLIQKKLEDYSKEALKVLDEFNEFIAGRMDAESSTALYDRYFNLKDHEKKLIESAYSDQLGDILKLGDQIIRDFLSRGYSLTQIGQLVQGIQQALGGVRLFDYSLQDPNIGHGSGMGPITEVSGADIATKFATDMSKIDPTNLIQRNKVIQDTIDYIKKLGGASGQVNLAVSNLINAITDPMAFQNALNIFKSTASTVTSLIDASEAYQKGQIDDKLLSLISDYPDLAEDIRNGTLDMADSIQIMVAKNAAEVRKKISDLEFQLQTETNAQIAAGIQAQIDTLEDMLKKESFLYGGIAEEFKVRETDKVSDRFKTQIDFIKKYNQEQQKEIDLMERKLNLNKSMLSLDRQIAALATDTSYGAQARSRDLQDQQRAAAVEREKLVMDLVTEQAISELEKERDKNIADIAANVAKIVEEMKKGTLGSNPFEADSALTFG